MKPIFGDCHISQAVRELAEAALAFACARKMAISCFCTATSVMSSSFRLRRRSFSHSSCSMRPRRRDFSSIGSGADGVLLSRSIGPSPVNSHSVEIFAFTHIATATSNEGLPCLFPTIFSTTVADTPICWAKALLFPPNCALITSATRSFTLIFLVNLFAFAKFLCANACLINSQLRILHRIHYAHVVKIQIKWTLIG